MRQLILSLFLAFIFVNTNGQLPINDKTNRIEYQKILEFNSLSKNSLYNRIYEWALLNDLSIILLDSIDNNKIICEDIFNLKYQDKGLLSTVGSKEIGVKYKLSFDFKDSKIRCSVTNINFLEYKNPSVTGVNWGYGLTTSKIKSGEIITYKAENYYPIDKNEKKYREMYNYFFENTHNKIIKVYESINNYLIAINDDW